MEYLLALIGGLGALAGYFFVKGRSAEALLGNIETGKKLNEVDKSVSKDQGLLEAEAQKREEIRRQTQAASDKQFETVKEMEDFLSRDLSKGPDEK